MGIKTKSKHVLAVVALTGVAMLASAGVEVRAEGIKLYNQPPSVAQLTRDLGLSNEPPQKGCPAGAVCRSIQFDSDAPAAPSVPVQSYPATDATPVATAKPVQAAAATPGPTDPLPTAAAPVPASARETSFGFPIQFGYNSSEILPASVSFLRVVADLLQQQPQSRLVIEGHTDSAGSASYDLKLSKGRAEEVRHQIALMGIDTSRLRAVGYGKSRPLPGIDPADARNRRVQFRLISG